MPAWARSRTFNTWSADRSIPAINTSATIRPSARTVALPASLSVFLTVLLSLGYQGWRLSSFCAVTEHEARSPNTLGVSSTFAVAVSAE